MVERIPIQPGAAGGAKAVDAKSTAKLDPQSGARFQSLLDELRSKASELEADSKGDIEPQDLSRAVGRAHESLQDALTLSEQLLEAMKANQLRKA